MIPTGFSGVPSEPMAFTRRLGCWIEEIDPVMVGHPTREVVSDLTALVLAAAASSGAGIRAGSDPLLSDPPADAFTLAADAYAERPAEDRTGLMDLAGPVVGASLGMAMHHPCSGAAAGAAILAGCEMGLLLGEMIGAGLAAPFAPLAAAAAAAAGARILGLEGDRLVSAIGIGVSSSVGAAITTDAVWQAGKSAYNGALAALLAEAGLTGPPDAIEHPRGLFGAVFAVDAAGIPMDETVCFGGRIAAMEPLVAVADPDEAVRRAALGLWEQDTAREVFTAAASAAARRSP